MAASYDPVTDIRITFLPFIGVYRVSVGILQSKHFICAKKSEKNQSTFTPSGAIHLAEPVAILIGNNATIRRGLGFDWAARMAAAVEPVERERHGAMGFVKVQWVLCTYSGECYYFQTN